MGDSPRQDPDWETHAPEDLLPGWWEAPALHLFCDAVRSAGRKEPAGRPEADPQGLRRRRVDPPPRGKLFQEDLLDAPFWMLACCQLVNLTNWEVAEGVYLLLRDRYRDELGVASAAEENLEPILRRLGLSNRRAKSLVGMARAWAARPPVTASDVLGLPGCGRYAADTWAIFIENRTDVDPTDGKLNWYLDELRQKKIRAETVSSDGKDMAHPQVEGQANRGETEPDVAAGHIPATWCSSQQEEVPTP